jgi:8-oxo-dGTP pyrophosphatase MutT (NUDIX family)
MIRRKDSLGFVEMIRGKYPLLNKEYILNILNEMTVFERQKIKELPFDELWKDLWSGNVGLQYRGEEKTSREKFEAIKAGVTVGTDTYSLDSLMNEVTTDWSETEWGFPKGRRNYQEKDIVCALREFEEETGFSKEKVRVVENLLPYDEIFTGSNYKSYKHRYYIAIMEHDESMKEVEYEKAEVSKVLWMTPEECMRRLRPYNKERITIIKELDTALKKYCFVQQ